MSDHLSMEELLNQYSGSDTISKGDVVKGEVISVNQEELIVNIGYMADGVLPMSEIPEDLQASFAVGDHLSVFIVKSDDGEGNVLLSIKKAQEIVVWDDLKAFFESEKAFKVKIKEAVKGGVVGIYNSARIFIPASQLSLAFVENLNDYVNTSLEVILIEFDAQDKKVVASHKAILKKKQKVSREDQLSRISKGDHLSGTVVRLADYGAFVDLGFLDGLIHVSQMSWRRVKHPSEILNEGDVVDVIVLDVDRDKEKVSLKLADVQENPWESIQTKYQIEDVVMGKVTRIAAFGAFVELEEGVEGLVHLSELAEQRIQKATEVVNVGDEVKVMVVSIEPENKKIGLSIKAAESVEAESFDETLLENEEAPATLSDLFGDKLKNLKF